jgi:MoaA/NifB/PqqE/SkfB family radical SAM enzyme
MKLSEIHTLSFEPSSNCNAQCPHCPRFNITDDDVFESTGTLHSKLKLLNLNFSTVIPNLQLDQMTSLRNVIIQGDKGDPLMNPNIDMLLDAFASMKVLPTVILTTNGSIRNTNWWQNLAKKYPFLTVRFSIDGLSDTNHLYRVGLNYNTIIKNLSAFTESGGRAIWKMLVFKHNQHQIKEVENQSRQLGCENIIYVECQIERFKGLAEWPVTYNNQTYYISPPDIDIPPPVVFKNPQNKTIKVKKVLDKNCPWGKEGHVYIGYQGHVLPCCMMHFDSELDYPGRTYLEKLSQGFDNQNLLLNSMEKILNNPLFNDSLEQSFQTGKWHSTCVSSCKQQILKNISGRKSYDIVH